MCEEYNEYCKTSEEKEKQDVKEGYLDKQFKTAGTIQKPNLLKMNKQKSFEEKKNKCESCSNGCNKKGVNPENMASERNNEGLPVVYEENSENCMKTLKQVDYYFNNLDELKLTDNDSIIMEKTGLFDRNTAMSIIEMYNMDVDEMILWKSGESNEDGTLKSLYRTEKEVKDAIYKALDMKVSMFDVQTGLDELSKEITPEKLREVYCIMYPSYKELGSLFILKKFNDYLSKRINENIGFIVKELENKKRMKTISQRIDEKIWAFILKTPTENFKGFNFITNVYLSTDKILAELTGKQIVNNTSFIKTYNHELTVMYVFFARFIYKNLFKEFETNILQRNVFKEFINGMSKYKTMDKELKETYDALWVDIWKNILVILKAVDES